jgi:hypothetical protein
VESSNLIKLLTYFTAFAHNALFQTHFSKLSLYNNGDVIGGCDITVCTGTPGTPCGAAYAFCFLLYDAIFTINCVKLNCHNYFTQAYQPEQMALREKKIMTRSSAKNKFAYFPYISHVFEVLEPNLMGT